MSDSTVPERIPPENKPQRLKKPDWLKTKIPGGETYFKIKRDLRAKNLFTVCEEAKCPNIGECWNTNTATFMVLGDTCTRACRFCNVKTGNPQGWVDPEEPLKTAESAKIMGLKYAVITMVDRDDMEDGGAAHVAEVVRVVKELNPGIVVELLTGDFQGKESSLREVLACRPDVWAHNLETAERLTPRVRDARAAYKQSLGVLAAVKKLADYKLFTKSALMLGLGEEQHEVEQTLNELRQHQVDFVTIGQYMRPTKRHLPIKRYVTPSEFTAYADFAIRAGFLSVASGPLVRSSYRAREFFEQATRA